MGSTISCDFIIFWDSSIDPYKPNNIPKWSPYSEEERLRFLPFYTSYRNSGEPQRISKDEKYWIDFDSGFQISKESEYRRRPILITWKELKPFLWQGDFEMEFRIPAKLDVFGGIFEAKISEYIKLLRTEISFLRQKKYPKLTYEYKNYLEIIENSPELFFENVIKMYTSAETNYLKRELDEILSHFNGENNKENNLEFDRIKHFYLALMASVNFFRPQTEEEIKKIIDSEKIQQIIKNEEDRKIFVYFFRGLSKKEAKKIEANQNGNEIIVFVNEFVMGSLELEKVRMFAKYSNNQKRKFIFEMELPVQENRRVNFTYLGLKNLKQNWDDEILIHSGAVFKIISVMNCQGQGENSFEYTQVRVQMSKIK